MWGNSYENVISENDQISWVLGSIERVCGEILMALDYKDLKDIEMCVQHIHELVNTLYP